MTRVNGYPQLAQEVLSHNDPGCGVSQDDFEMLVEAQAVTHVAQAPMCQCRQTREGDPQQQHVPVVAGAVSRRAQQTLHDLQGFYRGVFLQLDLASGCS